MRRSVVAVIASLTFAAGSVAAPMPTVAAAPTEVAISGLQPNLVQKAAKYKFKNCTALNKVYKHGVGKSHARDKTSGKPVTNFKHSTALYKKIIRYRSGLDRDKDGIACEKR